MLNQPGRQGHPNDCHNDYLQAIQNPNKGIHPQSWCGQASNSRYSGRSSWRNALWEVWRDTQQESPPSRRTPHPRKESQVDLWSQRPNETSPHQPSSAASGSKQPRKNVELFCGWPKFVGKQRALIVSGKRRDMSISCSTLHPLLASLTYNVWATKNCWFKTVDRSRWELLVRILVQLIQFFLQSFRCSHSAETLHYSPALDPEARSHH